jgi:hypothetical protein
VAGCVKFRSDRCGSIDQNGIATTVTQSTRSLTINRATSKIELCGHWFPQFLNKECN